MSAPTSKVSTKAEAAHIQRNKSETVKPLNKVSAQLSAKRVAEERKRTKEIKKSHKGLQSIQHEYEQFEINMDERD